MNYAVAGSKCGTDITFTDDDGRERNELSNANTTYCDKYGRLYDWETAMTVCPGASGWRLPNKAEWDELVEFAGGKEIAGKYLKSKNWDGEDKFGFSALAGGRGDQKGSYFNQARSYGYWWSASESSKSSAYSWCMLSGYDIARYEDINKGYLYSVRCVKD